MNKKQTTRLRWAAVLFISVLTAGVGVLFFGVPEHRKLRENDAEYALGVIFKDEWAFNPISTLKATSVAVYAPTNATEPIFWVEAQIRDLDAASFRGTILSAIDAAVGDGRVALRETPLKAISNDLGGRKPPRDWRPSDLPGERHLIIVQRRVAKGSEQYARGCYVIYSTRSDRVFFCFWQA